LKQSNRREMVFSYGLLIMSVTHFFAHIFDKIYPALFPIFREEFSLTLPQLGLLASVPPLFQTVFSIPFGYLADRISSKKAIALSFVFSILSALAVILSKNIWTLTIALSCVYLTTTIYHPASYSYTIELAAPENRSKALGIQNAGGPLGLAMGPISLALFMSLGLDWRFTYVFWIIPIALALLAVWRLRIDEREDQSKTSTTETTNSDAEATKKNVSSLRSILAGGFRVYLVFTAIRAVGGQIINVFLPLYLKDYRGLTVSEASLIYGAVSLFGSIAPPIGGFFADRLGNKSWLMATMFSSTLFLAASFVAPTTPLFLGFYFLQSFIGFLGMPANSSIIATLTPSTQRGLGYALSFLPGSVVGAITPTFSGVLAAQMGLPILFPMGIAISLVSLLMLKFKVKTSD